MPDDSDPIRLVIDVYGSDEPIEGELIEPGSHATRFQGWMSLAALIESVRGANEEADGAPTP